MKHKGRKKFHQESILEEMEPRQLFSGGIEGVLIDNTESDQAIYQDINANGGEQTQSGNTDAADNIHQELVFIDTDVERYQELLNDILAQGDEQRKIEVILLDNQRDGIKQISEALMQYQNLDAVHLISHGLDGSVDIGNSRLDANVLNQNLMEISAWGDAFSKDGDFLIYGCNLAASEDGLGLVQSLSSLTHTDVAASDDLTGHGNVGGDWNLEFSTGVIESKIAISEQGQKSWNGLLAFQTYRDEFNTVSLANSDGTQDWSSSPWQEIGESNGVSAGNVQISSKFGKQGLEIWQSGYGAMRQVDLSSAATASVSFEYARTGLDDATDYIALEISADGGNTWVELDRFEGPANDTSLQYASYDISAYTASNTIISFSSSGMNGTESLFIDNFQIAYAADLAAKSEFLVNQSIANTQQTSAEDRGSTKAVAVAPNGDYVVVWSSQNQDAGGWGIFMRQFDRQGNAIGLERQVNVDAASEADDQQWSSVAMDASGNFVIVWSGSGPGDADGVFYRRFNANGTAIDPAEIRVNTTTSGIQDNATVAMDADGNFVVVWEGNGNQPGQIDGNGVFGQRFNAGGVPVGGEFLVNTSTGSNEAEPAVAMDNNGNFIVVWDDSGGVQGQRYSNLGVPQGSKFTIDSSFSAGEAAVAMDADGDFVVAWRETLLGKGVYARRYDALGNAKDTNALLVNTTILNDQTNPSVDMDAIGNFIVTWEGDGSGDNNGVFGRKYNFDGAAQTGEFLINQSTTNTQHMSSVAMLNLNNYVVVWSGNGTGDTDGVYARQFGSGGANNAPTADASAGSPYVITEGDSLVLNGANSSDPDGDALNFSWDLNNDGSYGDVNGENPTVNWSTLQSLGINDNGSYTIGLRVDDGKGGINTTTTTLTVNNKVPVLTATGNATINQGAQYTLNLSATDSGADTITSWTINWGDGIIETIAGNPASVTHTYSNGGFTNNILASATDEDGTYLQNELFAVDFSRDSVFRFDTASGAIISSEFATGNGINNPVDVKIGPDGYLYVSSESSNDILRFNASTGSFVDIFVDAAATTQLGTVEGFAFGPDGNLYVADYAGKVVRFDAATGGYMDVFVTQGLGGLNQAYGITFGPDNNLYVSSFINNNVIKYNGMTGDLIGEFVTAGSGGLNTPEEMVFGPDGNLYVTSFNSNDVLRYNGSTGVFIDKFIDSNAAVGINGGLLKPAGLAFGPDGKLYVADYDKGAIRRYDGTTGVYIDDYVAAGTGGLTQPVFLEFMPQQQVTVTPIANNLPTLTTFAGTVETTNEDSEVEISFADLTAQGNEADVDGTVDAFVVKAVSSGTLKIGSSAGTATAWIAGTNDTINSTNKAYWTPGQDANGTLNAFAVVAKDDQGAISSGNITAQVEVIAQNDVPTLTTFAGTVETTNEDSEVEISFADLTAQGNEADVDGTVDAFVVKAVSSGTLKIGSSAGTASAWVAGTNDTIDSTNKAYWTPGQDANGTLNAFAVVAKDDQGAISSGNITAQVDVTAQNDVPTLTTFAGIVETTNEDFEVEISFADLTAQGDEVDIDGTVDAFVVKTVSSGTLKIGSSAGTATAWIAGTNDTINSTNKAYWTPDANVSGTLNAFELIARDNLNAESTSNIIVQVEVSSANDTPNIDDQTFSISENSVDGTTVGTAIASDSDSADSLSFEIIAGNNSNAFSINSSTGEITVSNSSQLNFESTPNYTMTVKVTDNGVGNLSDTASVAINLTNINENPSSVSLTNTSVDENIDTGSAYKIGSLTAIDEDVADTASYLISGGNDRLKFSISGINNDELMLNDGVLDFENQSSYEVAVTVIDSGGLSHEETFIIAVNDINENVASSSSAQNNSKQKTDGLFDPPLTVASSEGTAITSDMEQDAEIEFKQTQEQQDAVDETAQVGQENFSIESNQDNPFPGGKGKIDTSSGNQFSSTISQNYSNNSSNGMLSKMLIKAKIPVSKDIKVASVQLDAEALHILFEKSGFTDSLDSLREQTLENTSFEKTVVGSSVTVTTGLSIGYVIWLIRGGVLLSSVLSSLPAWRMIDPLPVIAHLNDSSDDDKDDSLESLVKKGRETVKTKFKLIPAASVK